jgi:hypothetical protein
MEKAQPVKEVTQRLVKNAQMQGTRSVLTPVRTNKAVATGVATLRVSRSDEGTSVTQQMGVYDRPAYTFLTNCLDRWYIVRSTDWSEWYERSHA